MVATYDNVKIYTVNGAVAGSSSALPDWLTRKRADKKGKGKRVIREHIEGTIELIQGFEFPEASNKVKTTRDGHHAVATGTYKPQIRVWDLDQLSLKFERHSDAENVDFILLSDDWTKSIHLQNDRSVELHTQGGFHYRTRIPRFGRSLAYHFPSCDTYITASENEVYRLNLNQGRFMTPLVLTDEQGDDRGILGVNCVDVNPAHQLLAFGVDGTASVQFWDPRSRARVGILRVSHAYLAGPDGNVAGDTTLSITALASRSDGLSYAVGTSTGHTLLYDIRTTKPFATKDQGYGLPMKRVFWIEGGGRMAGDGLVLSADKKVIKIWDRESPSTNFASITPASDINHVHHVPGSGVLLTASESIQMNTYFIPQLGPAPRWATFLENITEEMEANNTRSVYEDYKFLDRKELTTLGLDNLIGTPMLKPYMHGYFVSLKLYETARLIANPFAYAEHRERAIKDKMDKLAETRIRSTNKKVDVKVNKALAEKVLRNEERERKREERKAAKAKKRKSEAPAEDDAEGEDAEMDVDEDEQPDAAEAEGEESALPTSILSDPRFKELFSNPDFAVDETTREFALLNPSSVASQKRGGPRARTAVEEEEDESDKSSSDGLGGSSESEDAEESDGDSDKEALNKFDPRARPGQKNISAEVAYRRTKEQNRRRGAAAGAGSGPNLVPLNAAGAGYSGAGQDRNATFGQRRSGTGAHSQKQNGGSSSWKGKAKEAGMEMTWVPSSSAGDNSEGGKSKSKPRGKVERFGAGMQRGLEMEEDGSGGQGRTQRRKGVRSGSKNVFRRMDG